MYFLEEAVQRVPSGVSLVLEMSHDAGERLVMDEAGPEKRIVQRLVQVPRRRHRRRASENDREAGDTDRLETRQHEYGQRRDDERNSTGQSLAQDRETAGDAGQRAKAAVLARAQYRIKGEREEEKQWRVGRAVASAARDEEIKLQRRQRGQRTGQPSGGARGGKINQQQRRQTGGNRRQPRRELAFARAP